MQLGIGAAFTDRRSQRPRPAGHEGAWLADDSVLMNHRTGGARQHVQVLRPGVGAMCSCRAAVGPRQGEGQVIDSDLFGEAVNMAAPVTDLAAGGESLVTATVRDAAGPIHAIEFGSQSLWELHGGDTAVEVRTIRSV